MTDARAADPDRIARLEHDCDIVPVGADPEHCQVCSCAAQGHRGVEEIVIISGWHHARSSLHCSTCGAVIPREVFSP